MVEDTIQVVLGGALAAGTLGCLYVAFNTASVGRATRWLFTGLVLVSLAAAALGGGAREITFAFLTTAVLTSALFAVRLESLMHSTLVLTVTLLGVAGLFLTLGAEFIAAIQVLVYVGAIITLILFTVMLTAPDESTEDLEDLELPFGVTVERVETLQSAEPAFTGVGPHKTLKDTNPRKVTRVPATLEGVAIKDDVVGTSADPAPQPKEGGA